jgi:hypothetical protein
MGEANILAKGKEVLHIGLKVCGIINIIARILG